MSTPVTRVALYAEIWAEPMTTVAAKYGISSSYLARVCAELNVPRPARGYWAKLAHGKRVKRPALPAARPGDVLEWRRGGGVRREAPLPPASPVVTHDRSRKVRVARRTPHPMIDGARDHFAGNRTADSGHLRPLKRRLVDLYVSEAVLDRAIAFASALFWELESRGHQVSLAPRDQPLSRSILDERKECPTKRDVDEYRDKTWMPDRPTVTFIGTVAIALTIFEPSESVEVQYLDGKWIPTATMPVTRRRGYQPPVWTHHKDLSCGRLCVRASSPYVVAPWTQYWAETDGRALASSVSTIADELEAAAPVVAALAKQGAAKAEAERLEWESRQAAWEREEAERRRVRRLEESRHQLAEIIASWASAKAHEDFFNDLERRAADLTPEDVPAILERIAEARALLGGTDTLRRFASWQAPENR